MLCQYVHHTIDVAYIRTCVVGVSLYMSAGLLQLASVLLSLQV